MIQDFILDGLFAAIAAIGFAAVSRPPRRAYLFCAMIAAAGHSARFALMQPCIGMHIVAATFVASLLVGCLSVWLSRLARTPAETCLFPALLPMIPGMYAYRAFGGLAICVLSPDESSFAHAFYLFGQNAMTCSVILLGMAVGATIPIFVFKRISFAATR